LQDGKGGLTLCNHDRSSVGSCNLVKYERSLPKIYQNFKYVENVKRRDIRKVGGSVALGDYCPYVQEFSWKSADGLSRGTLCNNPKNQPKNKGENLNYALETYGATSKCIEQGKLWDQESCSIIKQWHRYGAGCYDYRCKDGKVNIIVSKGQRKEEIICDKAGQNISVALKEGEFLHMGAIICPGCIEMCGEKHCLFGKATSSNKNIDNREQKALINESSTNKDKSLTSIEVFSDSNPASTVGATDDFISKDNITINKTEEHVSSNESPTENEQRTSKSFEVTNIPDSKVGVKDELDCGGGGNGGGFFNEFFDYFDD